MAYTYDDKAEQRFRDMQYDVAVANLLTSLQMNRRYQDVFVVYDHRNRQVKAGVLAEFELTRWFVTEGVPAFQDSYSLQALCRAHNKAVLAVVRDVCRLYAKQRAAAEV